MMSVSDYSRLNLARAFILNPECLVIHKPDMLFNPMELPGILALLREHVDKRGLCMPASDSRRPRTLFYTPTTYAGMQIAEQVIEVKRHDEKMGMRTMQVTILGANNLKNLDGGVMGSSDPFAQVTMTRRHTKKRTETLSDALNPRWKDNSFEWTHVLLGDTFIFHVYDEDSMGTQELGSVQLVVNEEIYKKGYKGTLTMAVPPHCNQASPATIEVEIVGQETETHVFPAKMVDITGKPVPGHELQ